MGCGCSEMIKKMSCYEHQKNLAVKFSKHENVVTALYRDQQGNWGFIDITTPEYQSVTPIEYISPLQ